MHTRYLRPEGEERGAAAVHEQQLAGEGLGAAGVVVDAEGEPPRGVVDGEAVGPLEPHAGPLPHRVHRRQLLLPLRRRPRRAAGAVAAIGGVDPAHAGWSAGTTREQQAHTGGQAAAGA